MSGLFISIEGIEGVGKSSLFESVSSYLKKNHKQELVTTREPGGTSIAESIRAILLQDHDETLIPVTELLLMLASRAQHVHHVIEPALARGAYVLCDRFVDASFAYQGGGRNIDKGLIQEISKACVPQLPTMTLLLDAPVEVALERIRARGGLDRIENEDLTFFDSIRKTYLDLAEQDPRRFVVIDATLSQSDVHHAAIKAIEPILEHVNGYG
jgi:dTMP kinase